MLAHRKTRSNGHQQQQQQQRPVACVDQQQQYYMADELTWPTRLTIILIGASVLFSLFFGLEFIVGKLVSSLTIVGAADLDPTVVAATGLGPMLDDIAAAEQQSDKQCKIGVEQPFQWVRDVLNQTESLARNRSLVDPSERKRTQQSGRSARSKFGLNFELIYESELGLDEAKTHYLLEEDDDEQPEALLVKPELKLHQLLAGYHVAMPFDPDIWTLSEPEQQARELLSGHLFECHAQLSKLVDSIERSLAATMVNSSESGSGQPVADSSPLARVGHSHYKLMKLLDASGRPEAGLLMGHPFWLGSYLECQHLNSMKSGVASKRAGELPSDSQPSEFIEGLETRYCIGKLAFKSWLTPAPPSATAGQADGGPQQQSIKVGVCLPRQCDSLELFRRSRTGPATRPDDHDQGASDATVAIESVRRLSERLIRFNLNEQIYPASQLELVDIYCLPLAERRQLGAVAYLLLLFIVAWLALLVICTVLRSRRKFRNSALVDARGGDLAELLGERLIDCLAIDVNFGLFLSAKQQSNFLTAPSGNRKLHRKSANSERTPETTTPIVNLNVLDSIKHLGCAGVIMAHVLLAYLTLGTSYRHTIETIGRDLRTMLLLSLNNVVDTFFVISGLLVAYLTFKKMDDARKRAQREDKHVEQDREKSCTDISGGAKTGSRWLTSYLRIVTSRYMRMAPLYFLVYAFAKTISVHLGEGPLWDYATNANSLRGLCKRESWLWPLTFASDLKPISQHCVPPAWSISVDMQFFLVAPIFVRLLMFATGFHARQSPGTESRRRLVGYTVFGALLLLSTALTLADYKSLLDFVSLRDFARLRLHVFTVLIRHAAHAYSQPQNRMGPILIGLIGGHLLFEYEKRMKQLKADKIYGKIDTEQEQQRYDRARGTGWPFWMRGHYFKMTLGACLLFIVAPCLVQLRERARLWEANATDEHFLRVLVRLLLALDTSTKFNCHLALSGFVLIKLLWSVCNCIVFLRLITDLNQTWCARLMSLQFWQIMSRLNYAILLVHFEVIAYEAMSRLTHDQPITWTHLMTKFSFAYMSSLLIACPLYVLFEQPLHQLISGSWRSQSRQQDERSAEKKADLENMQHHDESQSQADLERRPRIKPPAS